MFFVLICKLEPSNQQLSATAFQSLKSYKPQGHSIAIHTIHRLKTKCGISSKTAFIAKTTYPNTRIAKPLQYLEGITHHTPGKSLS
jgi:hypothetical protein